MDNQPAPGFVCAGTLNVTAGGPASAVRTVQRVAANYTILCPRTNIILYETAGPAEALPGFESGKYQMALIENEPIASDLESANCEPSDAVLRLPLVLNPIVVVYRLPDVSRLVLDAPTVARIFGGQITRWQDPAIVALNPGTSLPDLAINTMPIEDPAALTGYVADYLSRAAEGGWRGEFAGTGERTEDGVLTAVDINDGAIGYASYTAAQERLVPTAELATTSDPNTTATPNPDSIADAVTAALADTEGDLTKIQESLYGATATINVAPYPLVGVQHLLACRNYQNPDVGATVRDFLTIATTQFNDPMSLASGELADRIAEAAQAVK